MKREKEFKWNPCIPTKKRFYSCGRKETTRVIVIEDCFLTGPTERKKSLTNTHVENQNTRHIQYHPTKN